MYSIKSSGSYLRAVKDGNYYTNRTGILKAINQK